MEITAIEASEAVNTDFMTPEEIHAKLQMGYDDLEAGKVQKAEDVFAKFRENH